MNGPCAAAEVSVDIFPAGPKPPNAKVGYVEMVSQVPGETYTKTIEIGNANHDGAEITPLPDRIHVRVKVRGQSLKGLPGRFKALYRVFWTT